MIPKKLGTGTGTVPTQARSGPNRIPLNTYGLVRVCHLSGEIFVEESLPKRLHHLRGGSRPDPHCRRQRGPASSAHPDADGPCSKRRSGPTHQPVMKYDDFEGPVRYGHFFFIPNFPLGSTINLLQFRSISRFKSNIC